MERSVVIVDDHPLYRDALKQVVEQSLTGFLVPAVGSIAELRDLLQTIGSSDLVLMDLHMPGEQDFSGLISIRKEFPEIPVVIVSAIDDVVTINKCIDLGASGFVPKSFSNEALMDCLNQVMSGEIYVPDFVDFDTGLMRKTSDLDQKLNLLTQQETRVLSMLVEGLLNRQIAERLKISEATVKAHVSKVLLKLDVISRTHAVILAMGNIGAGERYQDTVS